MWRCRIVNVRVCKAVVAYMGAIGASFEFGWMRALGREGVDSARCMPPALVEVTAVVWEVGIWCNTRTLPPKLKISMHMV